MCVVTRTEHTQTKASERPPPGPTHPRATRAHPAFTTMASSDELVAERGGATWAELPSRNCFADTGAVDLETPVASAFEDATTIEACQEACNALIQCNGITINRVPLNWGPIKCYRREIVNALECQPTEYFDTWIRLAKPRPPPQQVEVFEVEAPIKAN